MAIAQVSLVFGHLQSNKLPRFVLSAYVIVSFFWFGLVSGRTLSHEMSNSAALNSVNGNSDDQGFGFLPLMFRDLRNDGILRGGGKSLIVAREDEKAVINKMMMNGYKEASGMEMVSTSDVEKQNSLPNEAFDVVFVNGGSIGGFVDRSLRCGGVVVVRVTDESANSFKKPDGYKIVYLRKFSSSSVIIAMKKVPEESLLPDNQSLINSRLTEEARRAALKKLEDVLLEPPRASSGKSRSYHKRTKYLPDLLGDTLESYPRRVFIEVGLPEKEGGSGSSWFDQNYPTRNLKFEKYKIETVAEGKEGVQTEMSEWLRRNVKEEEYVVMKAEAEAVEEMVKSKAIRLIDELFMECRARGLSNMSNQNRRAYWECLALYGKLRDEGVAVHQWWG